MCRKIAAELVGADLLGVTAELELMLHSIRNIFCHLAEKRERKMRRNSTCADLRRAFDSELETSMCKGMSNVSTALSREGH